MIEAVQALTKPVEFAREVKLTDLASNLRTADRVHRAKYLQAVVIIEKALGFVREGIGQRS